MQDVKMCRKNAFLHGALAKCKKKKENKKEKKKKKKKQV